jgi:predicted Kef-type K+ transport protein
MDPVWIAVAFILGFAVRQTGLPPLVGFLAAGFVLNAMGVEGGPVLEIIADLGVTLLLFSIGLKLHIRSLLKPEVWAGASIHMLITVCLFGAGIYGLGMTGLSVFSGLDLRLSILIAFALSFSSTVFAVKVLEEKGEMSALYGRVSIGILIMQDIIAVVFLTMSTGKVPSLWAVPLIGGLFLIGPLLKKLMEHSGHGELLILSGLFLALVVGAAGFELVDMKADLGALLVGILLAGHPKASELSKSLMGFKDIFLVGFFLSIGLSGTPGIEAIGVAALLTAAVPFKVALFFLLLTRFRLRARTSLLASLSLANYSEFGLIVGAVGVANGWISSEWLVIIAIALSMTFVIAAPLNSSAHAVYSRFAGGLKFFETKTRLPEDEPVSPGNATIAIIGMGRVGTGAYDAMLERFGDTVIGLDFNPEKVKAHLDAGRNVILGDPTDHDFWEKAKAGGRGDIRLVMLTLENLKENIDIVKQLTEHKYHGMISASAKFDDEVEALKKAGVHAVYNLYAESGSGFAEHVSRELDNK